MERPRYFNTENFVRTVFKRPDISKWTLDGFVKDTVTPENDIVGVSKEPSKDISQDISKEAVDAKIMKLTNVVGENLGSYP